MPNDRNGSTGGRRSARASAPTFPPDDDRTSRPSHADSAPIARRRVSSAPAHEVDLDEVELLDTPPSQHPPPVAPASRTPPPSAVPPPLTAQLARAPSSSRPSQPPFRVPLTLGLRRPSRSLVRGLAYAAVAVAFGTAAGLVAQPRAPHVDAILPAVTATTTLTSASAPAAHSSPAPPPNATGVPVVDVAALPRAQDGTVTGAPGHRLWIDGALAASWQASVACGRHVVQVGSAGVPRTVDVPCGGAITVSP